MHVPTSSGKLVLLVKVSMELNSEVRNNWQRECRVANLLHVIYLLLIVQTITWSYCFLLSPSLSSLTERPFHREAEFQ